MKIYFIIGLVFFIINLAIAFFWEKTPDDFWIRIIYALFSLVAWPLILLVNILMAIFFKLFPEQKAFYDEVRKIEKM